MLLFKWFFRTPLQHELSICSEQTWRWWSISDGHQFFTKNLDGHHIFKSDGMGWWTIKFLTISSSPSIYKNPSKSGLLSNFRGFLIRRKPSANSRPYFLLLLLLLLLLLTTQFLFLFLCYLQFPRSFFFP